MSIQDSLSRFFNLAPAERQSVLIQAILQQHAWHYQRNSAYRHSAQSKGLGPEIEVADLARTLRPTAQVFKSYLDVLPDPFPEYHPRAFLDWLAQNLSIELPPEQVTRIQKRYRTLEGLLADLERVFAPQGFVIGNSSGTSGRATIMLRDRNAAEWAIEAYKQAVYRLWGTKDRHQIVFVMPARTRIVMAWVARLATERLGLAGQSHFAIPFTASPDQVRIRSGMLFKPGLRGQVEARLLFPFMNYMFATRVQRIYVERSIDLLEQFAASQQDVLLFGGWIQLDHIYTGLLERGYGPHRALTLSADSMIGTGGGIKEFHPRSPAEIRQRLASVLKTPPGTPVPHRDVYGMAEANWAAAQCEHGNYHLPPWVLAAVLDDRGAIIPQAEASGLLAFWDPIAGGDLYPSFFKTADQVRLVNGGLHHDESRACPCGYRTAYLVKDSIQRKDRLDEAGCAGQL